MFALRIAVPRGGIEKPNAFVIGGFKRRFGLRLGDNFVRITECAAAKAFRSVTSTSVRPILRVANGSIELNVEPIGVAVFDQMPSCRRGEMGSDDQRRRASKLLIDCAACGNGLGPVDTRRRTPFRVRELAGMVEKVAGNQCALALDSIITLTCPGVCPGVGTNRISGQICWSC